MGKQPLGMELQDVFGLAGTKPSDYVTDEDGNIVFDRLGKLPVKKINSYFTADIKDDEEKDNG